MDEPPLAAAALFNCVVCSYVSRPLHGARGILQFDSDLSLPKCSVIPSEAGCSTVSVW